ncbi:MAG: response regulator [Candidatus Thiodiazotropha sp.]
MTAAGDSHNRLLMQQLPEILANIELNWPVLPSGMWNGTGVRSVLRHLNELARKSRQAGLVNINKLTQIIDRAVNEIYEENAQPDREEIDHLNERLKQLQAAVAATRTAAGSEPVVASSFEVIYLHPEKSGEDQVTEAIQKNGWRVLSIHGVEDLRTALVSEKVRVLLVDTEFMQQMGEVNQLFDELRAQKKRRPELIFLSNRCDIEIRLEVLRTGATQCFSKPININDLMLSIRQIISPEVQPHHRVLIVEDDESQAQFASALLRKGALETLAITDPLNVMQAVERFQPDLILMDLYMPGANGIELTQVIRQRDESLTIPIVFLSGEDDLEKKMLALHSGADDFLTKPVRPQHLLATVKTRINRAKSLFAAGVKGHVDQTTGLQNRRQLLQQLDLCSNEMRSRDAICTLFIITIADQEHNLHDIDFDIDDHNVLLLDIADLAAALFGKRDFIARTDNQSLGILLQRKTEADLETLCKSLCEQLNEALAGDPESEEEQRFGVGFELIDADPLSAYVHLSHAETAALRAYRDADADYLRYQQLSSTAEVEESSSDDFQKHQFATALNTGLIEFVDQRFTASHDLGKEIRELMPIPAPATDIVLISDDIYLTAERHELGESFNQYICKNAIKRLGDNALKGDKTQIIIRLTTQATKDEKILEFIKSELRSLQLVGTGLMVEFNLPSLASNLKQARHFLGELSAMGIASLLGNFACNETAYKVLAYLKADGVRPHLSLMQSSHGKIQEIATQVHSLHAKIILPRVERFGQISLQWSDAADFVQADYDD